MKAIVFTRYGSPDGLELRDLAKPIPKDNELLIRVHATSVTAGDTEIRRLKLPLWLRFPMRLYAGLRRPKRIAVLGMELAGEVEQIGTDVTRFSGGDQVFAATGFGFGAYAQYVCLPEGGTVALKPQNMSYEEAAAVPVGGLEALSFVRRARIEPGQSVLIYGGSGSIGTFAVQLARHFGAVVTAVCNPRSLDLVKSLGADTVLDYTKEDFTTRDASFDVIIDAIGKSPFSGSLRRLKKNGRYLLANPKGLQMIRALWLRMTSGTRVIFGPSSENPEDLVFLKELIEAGKLKSIIDRRYPLERITEAHGYVDQGRKTGNVIITVQHEVQAEHSA